MKTLSTPELVVVPELSIQVATGETCYPNENGFAAHWAEVITADRKLVQTLTAAAKEDRRLLLRCAMLDVVGRVTKQDKENENTRFAVSIEDLIYRKPGVANNVA